MFVRESSTKYERFVPTFLDMTLDHVHTQALGKPARSGSYTSWPKEAWQEIETLLRLCHMACFNSRTKDTDRNHGHTADMLYVATLLAAVGPLSMRVGNYGLAMTLIQSLAMSSDSSSCKTGMSLQDWTKPHIMRLFGLSGNVSSGHYETVEPSNEERQLLDLEEVTSIMLTAISKSGHKTGKRLSSWQCAISIPYRLTFRVGQYLAS